MPPCSIVVVGSLFFLFFFNDTATTEIYTLSLHDALPICGHDLRHERDGRWLPLRRSRPDRKSTRLNSSHANISYAVFCLKKTTSLNAVLGILQSAPHAPRPLNWLPRT